MFAIVLGVNLIPAFGPPTWAIIALYVFSSDMSVPAIVIVGALAAATGRYLLALAFRHLGGYLPDKMKRNLTAVRSALEQRRRSTIIALGLFALSPVPSAQLFEAAGLAGVRLTAFTTVFFLGRTISYSVYAVSTNRIKQSDIGEPFQSAITSPIGIASQVVMIMLLAVLVQIDWEKVLGSKPSSP